MRQLNILFTLLFSLGASQVATAQLSPLTIGAIQPGDSIVVYYDVTINEGAGTKVSNQGTITAPGIMLVTDDPETGLPHDPTVTLLNLYPLPVTLYSLSAVPQGNAISVRWTVAVESDLLEYQVERSTDGQHFKKVGQVAALNKPQEHHYSFLDAVPGNGTYYYRLKIIETLSPHRYSRIVRVDLDGKGTGIRLFPNPSYNRQFTLQVNNMPKGNYSIDIYNHAGQPVHNRTVLHEGGSANRGITLPATLTKGMYFVRFGNGKVMYMQPLLLLE